MYIPVLVRKLIWKKMSASVIHNIEKSMGLYKCLVYLIVGVLGKSNLILNTPVSKDT